MIQSKIKPIVVRLKKMRRRYSVQGMKLNEFYSVIGYDMKNLLVTNQKAEKAYYMLWKDTELYRSEYIVNQFNPSISGGDIQALRRTMKKLTSAIPSITK